MFLRPLSQAASTLVFFSRRTDMPFRYTTSLANLHFPEDAVYEVSPMVHGSPSSQISMHFGGVRGSTLTLCLWDEGTAAHWVTLLLVTAVPCPAMPCQ